MAEQAKSNSPNWKYGAWAGLPYPDDIYLIGQCLYLWTQPADFTCRSPGYVPIYTENAGNWQNQGGVGTMEWMEGLSWWSIAIGVVLIVAILFITKIFCLFSRWFCLPMDDQDDSKQHRYK